ncbi:MAG: DUF2267 domain-containing protein [Halobacteriota archaeon]
MKFEEFTGQVQNRLELAGQGETVRASRAILTTLGERLSADTARELAEYLPMEIDRFLLEAEPGQEFSYRDFVHRVGDYEHEEAPDANYDAQLFVGYLAEFVPGDVMQRVRDDLPAEFDRLFEVADREAPSGE